MIYKCALYNWKLSHHLRDIRLLSIPWPWNPGYGSLKVIENYTIQFGTDDFLLTFHSNHRPISHRFRDKWQNRSKIAYSPRVLNAAMKGFPLEFVIGVRGYKCLSDGATRWSKKFSGRFSRFDTALISQYRLWQTDRHPASHVVVASTRYAIALRR